jgi:hypothetical protein
MIQTGFESRVKIQDIIANQLPEFILDESPKTVDFLKQYYISQEYQGGPVDIAENLDQYLKLDNLTPEVVVDSTTLSSSIGLDDTTITVSTTKGFPSKYGLLKIDDEIITYTGLTTNTFTGCIRGFSGITTYHNQLDNSELVFNKTERASHTTNSTVNNLSSLFLKEFYKKLKYTFAPGFEDRQFNSNLNVGNFLKEIKSFYESKGTEDSFRILFNVLYGETPKIINLENYLLKPSDAQFIRREIVVAESISGDPTKLVGQTLFKSDDTATKASISAVESFTRKGIQYFKISLFVGYEDNTSIEGIFKITPSTKCLEAIEVGSSVIFVDSTIGFSQSGNIISGNNLITYTDKNVNQFLNCYGIIEEIQPTDNIFSDETYFSYENGDTSKKVELRLTGVLSDFVQKSKSILVDEGQILTVKSIGDNITNPEQNKTYKQIFANSWIYNTSSSIEIESFTGSGVILRTTVDRSQIKKGDRIEIIDKDTNSIVYPSSTSDIPYVDTEISSGSRNISLSNFDFIGNSNKTYSIRRKINKSRSSTIPFKYGNQSIISDVQNLYIDESYAYVASNSLPSYGGGFTNYFNYEISKSLNESTINTSSGNLIDQDINTNFYTSISFDNPVSFITGERIFYQPVSTPLVGLETGSYYVKVLDDPKNIKLYTSPSFIEDDANALQFSFPPSGIGTHSFILYSQKSKVLDSSKVLKKFTLNPNIKDGKGEKTIPGSTGMLINGVEIFNYKTYDKIYYGPVENVRVLNGGSNFDVINPPKIEVSSGFGVTALVTPVISGSITDIFVDTQDFDVNQVLSVNVTGGNVSGGSFRPILTKRKREILFDARPTVDGGGISTTTSQLTFLTEHNLSNGDEIIYRNNGNPDVSIGIGLSSLINNSSYYVKVDNNTTVKLFKSFNDYSLSTNAIGFAGTSLSGTHKFLVGEAKNTISEIKIIDGGKITNRNLLVIPSGISTINNTITFKNHGFNSGELVTYSPVVGLGTNNPQTISGLTTTNQYYVLKTDEDTFRLCDAGIDGNNILNYEQQKTVTFSSTGTGFQQFKYPDVQVTIDFTPVGVGTTTQSQTIVATPVIKGSIVDLYLYETGTGYGSSILNIEKKPSFTIKNGKEGQVEPIILNGSIVDTNLQFGGFEYFSVPELKVFDSTGSGIGAKLRAVISNGKISDVKVINSGIGYSTSTRIDVIPTGSGALFDSNIRSLSINEVEKISPNQYEIFSDQDSDKLQYFVSGYYEDLRSSFQDDGNGFSKIIGWAYDGNPIYGSYGLNDPNNINSGIKTLTSSYVKDSSNIIDRPSTSDFPLGFFVEDYRYNSSGDLDENNGRFSKTPDFPEGIYAYYASIDPVDGSPIFPYFIGDQFRSNTIDENSILDQDFDFDNSNLVRNTFPYKVSDLFADNDFIIETNEIKRQKIIVDSISDGSVTGFDIINPGENYKINDNLLFDSENTNGGGIQAKISSIKGKTINRIETVSETFNDSIFVWEKDRVRVYILPSHELSNQDYVTISGFSTSSLSKLNDSFKISSQPIPSVGLTTEITSSGAASTEIYVTNIPVGVSVGNSIGIGTETLEILNTFPEKNILRVKRNLPGTSHDVGTAVSFKKNSFTIDTQLDYFESKINYKTYFNPKESIGFGTVVGVSSDVSFSFGNETISRSILTQRIYIENHQFNTNQRVIFGLNGNSPISISTSPSGTPFNLPSTVYVVNKSPNTIAIKTSLTSNEIFFRSGGDNEDDYFFESTYSQKLGTVKKIKSTVSVSTSHGLVNGDIITLNIKPNLNVGVGNSSSIKLIKNQITNYLQINPIGFNSLGINTSTNEITLLNHNLRTGDKVNYSANELPIGLTTGSYYVYKITDDKIKLSDSYKNTLLNPPVAVSIASSGGSSQSISKINPQIESIRNNNLVFDLTDSSLIGYKLKIYYDQDFKNEFVSTGSTISFSISGVGTVGISTNASLTLNYDSSIPEKLYYSLEKSGYISTSDSDVRNYSEILFVNSVYNQNYNISGVGLTTFEINLNKEPENLLYTPTKCDVLEYSTTSSTAKGPVNKINLISGGIEYKKAPTLVGSNSLEGQNLYVVPKSKNIGNIKQVRIINQGFEYSSDRTLEPQAFISPHIVLKDSNTVGIITVVSGGKNFISEPQIVVVNKDTREVITNGLLRATLSGNSISRVDIEVPPKGISDESADLFTVNNTNGISIKQVKSSSTGIFTCVLTTPISGFSTDPFSIGDEVFIEGIQKYSANGDGFNSSDYGYKFFTISNYQNKFSPGLLDDQVTINVSGLTTNTGIAKTIQDSSGTIVSKIDYPVFRVSIAPSSFEVGEKLVSNGSDVDLEVVSYDGKESIKVFGSYDLSVGEVITGKSSGNVATIQELTEFDGGFKVDFSSKKDEGWENETGKLNQDYQVTPNNDYYQNLSYSIKSRQEWNTIRTPVNSLVHTSGFKNFSDTEILSDSDDNIGLSTTFNETTIIKDIFDEKRVDTIYNFDFVKDIDVIGSNSKFLKLKNKKLTNYTEVGSNIVLKIDDLSSQFSNFESEPKTYKDIFELNLEESYLNYIFKVTDIDKTEFQLTNLTIVNDNVNNNSFIFEKQSLVNVGTGLTHQDNEEYGSFTIESDEFGVNYLRFTPNDPFNIEYDLKYIEKKFTPGVGVGTISIGLVDITSKISEIITGSTSTIVGFSTNLVTSMHVTGQVIQETTNEINFVELYITHDGTDTNISEYYFDSIPFNRSNNLIGSFSADINSGSVLLNYTNDTSFDVTVKVRVVSFKTSSSGTNPYRFRLSGQPVGNERSVIYQSNSSTTTSGLSTSVITLNKNNFDSIKSLVEVSIGATKSIHQVLLVQDVNNIYTQQTGYLSIGSTTGIGTFGGEYHNVNDFALMFYPDPNFTGNIEITSINQCLYSEVDFVNEYPDLLFGNSSESIKNSQYFAINGSRINRRNFILRNQGTPIFAKTFDPADPLILNPSTGTFTINNHFFSNNEEIIYTPKSTFVGVGSTPLSYKNGSITDTLPSTVFIVNKTEDTFQIATTRSGVAVTFTSIGEGNAHQFAMSKNIEKCLITLDNVAQYPLIYTKINTSLSGNGGGISTTSTTFALSGISTINPLDILKIDDEYIGVINVGLGTTNIGPITNTGNETLVEVERGFVGSSATSHTDGTNVDVYKGSYNIVGDEIFFVKAPRGNISITRNENNLQFETSEFTGRVFLRKSYDTNQIYDDISNEFTGIGRTFTLTVGGANTTGIGSTGGNGLVFINGIFQTPTTVNNPSNNFTIIENNISGISSIVFSGIRTDPGDANSILAVTNDINQNQIPRGGIIVSLGSSGGLGYAPLVGASVTAVVGAGGSIASVGLGSTDINGSGYNGIVSIGVSVYEEGHSGGVALVTATVGAGGTLSFAVNSGGTGYVNPQIFVSEPSYENLEIEGISRIGLGLTTDTGVGLLLNVEVGSSSTTGIGSTYFEVSNFSITRSGYSFRPGDVFKPVGLVTDSRLASPLSEFRLTVLDTFSDNFGAWQFGELDFIDSIKNYQDGRRLRFPLFYNGSLLSFEKRDEDSEINLSNLLLVIINGVIQDPDSAYNFDGGTSFSFTTAPKPEDDIAVFFYRGTRGEDDLLITNILPTLERGDNVQVLQNNNIPNTISQEERTIFDLSYSDKFETNLYFDQGIDEINDKPMSWTKQKTDRVINGEFVYKTRESIISQVYPTAKIIGDVNSSDTRLFVDDPDLFTYNLSLPYNFGVILVNENDSSSANIVASIGAGGTISSLTIIDGGNGYTGATIDVKFSSPLIIGTGIGTTAAATVTVGSGGSLTTPINITNPGFGYTTEPLVIVPSPETNFENIIKVENVKGFSGIVTGISTTINSGQLALKFDLKRNTTFGSDLEVGYPIFIHNTYVGSGVISVDTDDSAVVGIGTTFLDNIYYVNKITTDGVNGSITCNIDSGTVTTGITTSGDNVGRFSWGLMTSITRSSAPISIGVTGKTVDVGLSTFPSVQRRSGGLRQSGSLPERLD